MPSEEPVAPDAGASSATLARPTSVGEVVALLRSRAVRLYAFPGDSDRRTVGLWRVATRHSSQHADPLLTIHSTSAESIEDRPLQRGFDGLKGGPAIAEVPQSVCEQIEKLLDTDHEVRWLSARPIVRCFVYFDISDYSTYPAGQQALMVAALPRLVAAARDCRQKECTGDPERIFCSGDGYIFMFPDSTSAAWFAAQLANRIDTAVVPKDVPVEIHYRMGVHVGEVFPFEEAPGKWNFAGDGINGGKRVIDAIGRDADDLIFISEEVRKAVTDKLEHPRAHSDILANLVNRGRRKDKHKRTWRVYELNHRNAVSGT